MKGPIYCTLTGVDDHTSTEQLFGLGVRFPFAEFGVLYSEAKQGTGRYRKISTIESLVEPLKRYAIRPRLSLHICGRGVKKFLSADWEIQRLAVMFNRVQLNLRAHEHDLNNLRDRILLWGKPVITQHNRTNEVLVEMMKGVPNHQILFDSSGGRGISPTGWRGSIFGATCGYAGGLGPDNLANELPKISKAAGGNPYWIDMEGKLRDENDRFDFDKVERCLEIVSEFKDSMKSS